MSRPASIKNESILDAARKVFLQHGYLASTAQLARAAGVSEGSLFKHFKSKNHLFCEAMRAETRVREYEQDLLHAVGRNPIHTTLERICQKLLAHFQVVMPRIITFHSSGVSAPHCEGAGDRPPQLEHVDVLARYFREEIRLGRLKLDAPEILAHALVAGLIHYVLCDILYQYRPGTPAVYVRTLVNALLHGAMSPAPHPAPARKGRKS